MDVQANFEKAYWTLEPTLPDNKKELTTATLQSIALNYIERKFHLATLRCTLISHFAISQVIKEINNK